MKHITCIALFLLIASISNSAAQGIFVDNKSLDSIENGEYISIHFSYSWGKMKLKIDQGQQQSFFKSKTAKNEYGKPFFVYSKTHAFNLLADKGWVYIDRYDFILDKEEGQNHTYLKNIISIRSPHSIQSFTLY